METVQLSDLELTLLRHYVNCVGGCIKAKESEASTFFYLIFYLTPYSEKRPAIKFDISYWGLFRGEEKRIGPHPFDGVWSSNYPLQHINADRFYEATRDELIVHFQKKLRLNP